MMNDTDYAKNGGTVRVYVLSIAESLMKLGHKPIMIVPDMKKAGFLNWIFERNDVIVADLDEILDQRRRDRGDR